MFQTTNIEKLSIRLNQILKLHNLTQEQAIEIWCLWEEAHRMEAIRKYRLYTGITDIMIVQPLVVDLCKSLNNNINSI